MISNPEVNRTLATLRKAEFGFLGVIVDKLTDKSPLLSLYRTVHEIFTSYGSSFNSFEVIFFVRESPPFFHSVPKSHSDQFIHVFMFQLNTFHLWSKEKILLCEIFGFSSSSIPISHRYSVWINREPFLLYESIFLHSNSFPIPLKSQIGSKMDGLVWAYPCGYALFK